MTSEPCVSATLPSKVATFFESSAIMLSDSMLMGLSRSARSASAGCEAAHAAAKTSAATARALFPGRRIEDALDLGLQRERVFVLFHHHPDSGQDRASRGDDYGTVGAHHTFLGEHVQELGAGAK